MDLRVEANKADSTILDLYPPYPIPDWNVLEVNDQYRHDVRVRWDPYEGGSLQFASSTAIQPLIVRACPAGGTGSVLACSGTQ